MINDACSSVAIAKPGSRDTRDLETSVLAALKLLGGIERLVMPGMRVFIKLDLPTDDASRQTVTDYMRLLTTVGKAARDCGGRVDVGDSLLFSRERIEPVWERTGLADIARANGFRPVNLERAGTRPIIRKRRVYYISRAATESDIIFNLPRMRTAPSGCFKGAVWNLIGLLPGHQKIKALADLGGSDGIAEVCADILSAVSPDVNITMIPPNANQSRDGCKPTPDGGAVLASSDAVALDTVASGLAGRMAEYDPVLAAAAEAGLGIGWKEGIRVQSVAGRFETLSDRPAAVIRPSRFYGLVAGVLSSAVTARIEVNPTRCSACGVCVSNCPINGLVGDAGRREPIWRESVCSHCWTCTENCPEGALGIRWGVLAGGALSLWRRICDV